MELEYCFNCIVWVIVWDPNKAIDIGEWSISGGCLLERFYRNPDIYIYIYIYIYSLKGVYPHVRPRSRSRPRLRSHPQSIQYCSSHVYPLAVAHSRSRYSAISLVIESECERSGADADTHVDTLL